MRAGWKRRRAQAVVEAALVAPILVLLVLGAVGIGRLVHARMALDAATREAARAAVLSPMPSVRSDGDAERRAARSNGINQGEAVARGYGLDDVEVRVEFDPDFEPHGWVNAEAQADVPVVHVPFMRRMFGEGAGRPTVSMRSQHLERIDRYRSRLP